MFLVEGVFASAKRTGNFRCDEKDTRSAGVTFFQEKSHQKLVGETPPNGGNG